MFVRNPGALIELCNELRQWPEIGLDTEFAAERRYFPRFDLLQLSTREMAAAVDVHAVQELGPLLDVLCEPGRTLVVHAGAADLAILHRRTGRVPPRVFDTQLAAAMVGHGTVSYQVLVRKVINLNLPKTETLTDWSKRPLKPEQIQYALDDVRYLLPLYDRLLEELEGLHRLAWFEEEAARQVDPQRFSPADVRERWRRLAVRYGLTARQTAVLEEVAAWREGYAMRKDQPARAILPDEILPHLARRQPGSLNELREIRNIFERTVHECGNEMLAAVRAGLDRPLDSPSEIAMPPELPAGVVELLDAVVKARAEEGRITPGLLVGAGDLERLVADYLEERPSEVDLVRGWRRDLAGADVLRVLAGEVSIRIDPTGRLRMG